MTLMASNVEAEAGCTDAMSTGATAQPRKSTKRPLHLVFQHAYVYEKMRNKLGPWIQENAEGTITVKMRELAEELSPHVSLAVPKKKNIEQPPAQMLQFPDSVLAERSMNKSLVGAQNNPPKIEPRPALMLRFANSVPDEAFTNRLLVGADSKPLQIELVNIESGEICVGEFTSLEVEIFVIEGDFTSDDGKLRTLEALSPRKQVAMPLLVEAAARRNTRKGLSCEKKFIVKLHNGRAVVRGKITDNSSWVRSGTFKLVARSLKESYEGIRIKRALSEEFPVKESKLEARRKHEIPLPEDPTWRLANVGKEYHKRLQDIGVSTVWDFRKMLESDPNKLKKTLGMQNLKWESTVEHARKCQIPEEDVNGMENLESPNSDLQAVNIDKNNLTHVSVGEQMVPELSIASDQMEAFSLNTSYNENDESNEAVEGMGKYPTLDHLRFSRLESNQWTRDYQIHIEDGYSQCTFY